MKSEVYNMGCLEYMRTLPDKAFAIAIADPPYGGAGNEKLDGGGGSVNASTGTRKTSAPAGGGQTLHFRTPQKEQELHEQEELGRRNTQKNC